MFDRLIASKTSGTVSVLVPASGFRRLTAARRSIPSCCCAESAKRRATTAWTGPRRVVEPNRGGRATGAARRPAPRLPGRAASHRHHGNCHGAGRDRHARSGRAWLPGAPELTPRLRGGGARIRAGRPVPARAHARAGGAGARAPADQLHAQAASLTVEPPLTWLSSFCNGDSTSGRGPIGGIS